VHTVGAVPTALPQGFEVTQRKQIHQKQQLQKIKPDEQLFMTVPQLARRWAISPAAAYRAAGSVVPVLKVGASIRVPIEAVEKYEKAQLG
jgi:hypothetical protein